MDEKNEQLANEAIALCVESLDMMRIIKRHRFLDLPDIRIYEDAIKIFGNGIQQDIAIEEMSELTKAIIKYRRHELYPTNSSTQELINNISEEMADVYIMLEQLKLMFDNHLEIDRMILEKSERLKERIKQQKEKDILEFREAHRRSDLYG